MSKHRELWDGGGATFAHIKHDHSPQPDDRDCDDGIPKYLLHHVLLEATSQEKHFSTLVTKDEVMGKVMPPNLLYKLQTARL